MRWHRGYMSRVRALVDALELQQEVGDRVRPEDLDLASRCEGWTLRQVLNHSVGVTRKFTDFASGATNQPHAPPGDLVGPDHRVALQHSVSQARTAWAAADMSRVCRLPFGTFSAEEVAGINLFDVMAHTWDIAAPTGVDLDEEHYLWGAGLECAREVIGARRDPVHYDPEVPLSDAAPAMTRFLAFLGRRPNCR